MSFLCSNSMSTAHKKKTPTTNEGSKAYDELSSDTSLILSPPAPPQPHKPPCCSSNILSKYLLYVHAHVHAQSLQSCPTLCDPMDWSPPQAPLSMGFSRQEYWGGLPFPSPEDLPNLGTVPASPALQVDSLLTEPPGKPASISPWHTGLQGKLGNVVSTNVIHSLCKNSEVLWLKAIKEYRMMGIY